MNSITKCLFAAAVSMTLVGVNASAQEAYPSKPVKIVVPYAPGGSADLFARTLGKHLQEIFGTPFIVDNRPGASQMIGAMAVATAPADGYTLFLGSTTSLAVNSYTQSKNIKYDPIKDFAPVSLGMTAPLFLVTTPSLPAKSVKELIALAKSAPGKYTFASIGIGSSTHVAMEEFMKATGTKMLHVPFKSSVPAINAMLAGTVDVDFDVGSTAIPMIKSGKLRALAVGSTKRFPLLPDLPTAAEAAGIPGFEAAVWWGLVAPAQTPQPIVDKLSKEINRVLRLPDVQDQFLQLGLMLTPNTPDEFGAMIKAEVNRWNKELREVGVQPE